MDDGLATGASMGAAAQAVPAQQPKRVIVAVSVASREACAEFRRQVHDVICAATPEPFYSVGAWYDNFSQTSDEEVANCWSAPYIKRSPQEIHDTNPTRKSARGGGLDTRLRELAESSAAANPGRRNHYFGFTG